MLEAATDEDRARLKKLEGLTNFNNLDNFAITYNRHKGLYGHKRSNFPESYSVWDSALVYVHDPAYSVKFRNRRLKLKRALLFLALIIIWVKLRVRSVEKFDHNKRMEQRAMQNKEIEEFAGKHVEYTLFKPNDKDEFLRPPQAYQIIWYDSKMKNYELLQEFFKKKRLVRA